MSCSALLEYAECQQSLNGFKTDPTETSSGMGNYKISASTEQIKVQDVKTVITEN